MTHIAITHEPFIVRSLINSMVIFHSYVKLPNGNVLRNFNILDGDHWSCLSVTATAADIPNMPQSVSNATQPTSVFLKIPAKDQTKLSHPIPCLGKCCNIKRTCSTYEFSLFAHHPKMAIKP